MAYPTILVDSVNGAASPGASGAGPGTAVTGTNNGTSDGLTPSTILLGGAPDLSGVATDGSAAIYLVTAAGRRFSKISAVDNVLKTVTIEDTITAANCTNKSWAIGGKLASLFGTGYVRLVDDAASSGTNTGGDAKGGWIIEFQSAHAETAATTDVRVGGDTTIGQLIIRGISGAATKPVITTSSSNGLRFLCLGGPLIKDFTVKQTTSAASFVIKSDGITDGAEFRRMTLYSTGATKASAGIRLGGRGAVYECEIYDVLTGSDPSTDATFENNYFHDCATAAISATGFPVVIQYNVFADCGKGVINSHARAPLVQFNVFDTCTTGYEWTAAGSAANAVGICDNNIFANCTTGLHHNHASAAAAWFAYYLWGQFKYNAFWNNTTHLKLNSTSVAVGTMEGGFTPAAEPFTTATKAARKTAGDWSVTTEMKAAGWPPAKVGMMAVTRNYVDVGVQRQEAGGSGGGGYVIGG